MEVSFWPGKPTATKFFSFAIIVGYPLCKLYSPCETEIKLTVHPYTLINFIHIYCNKQKYVLHFFDIEPII